jgi:hypothetical protein
VRSAVDWAAHRDALLAFWISGEASYELPNRKGWLLYYGAPGTRPWAWWHLEEHPPRAEGEAEPTTWRGTTCGCLASASNLQRPGS